MTARKWTRFVYIPDPHGDQVHEPSWKVLRNFVTDFAPTRVVYGGDVFDLRPLRTGATAEEKAQSLEPDFQAGMRLFEEIKPTDFCLGNHDRRAWVIAKNDTGPVGDFCRYLVRQIEDWARQNKVALYPYRADSFCPIAPGLNAVHGNVCNIHTAAALAQIHPGTTLAGHTHSRDYYRAKSVDMREAYVCGCLCNIWQEYNEVRPNTLRHIHGFAFGAYQSNGTHWVQTAYEGQDGTWRIPTEVKEYRA